MTPLHFFSLLILLLLVSLSIYLPSIAVWGVLLSSLASYLLNVLWLKPLELRWKLQRQGIEGPRPSLLYGNSKEMQKIQAKVMEAANVGEFVAKDYTPTLFPYFVQWSKEYGTSCRHPFSSINIILRFVGGKVDSVTPNKENNKLMIMSDPL